MHKTRMIVAGNGLSNKYERRVRWNKGITSALRLIRNSVNSKNENTAGI